jgi:UPF0755 protein
LILAVWRYLKVAIPLVLLSLGGSWLWWQWATSPMQEASATTKPTILEISSGTASDQIGQQLEQAGLIRSQLAWKLWVRWLSFQQSQGGLQAGMFELSGQQSLPAIADKIWRGEVVQTQFTIPEGWSIQQMAAYFEQQKYFPAADFRKATTQIPRDRYPWLPENLPSLEGFLFPDTYQIPAGPISAQQVIDIMLQRFAQAALPLYQQQSAAAMPLSNMSLQQWVTFSSIVEKEAVISKERPTIAGVFLNRLQQGIPLGSDPTVEYALGIQQTPDQPLTFAQVKIPSPYNTYINAGLPPTAIASPGLASLKAVLKPAKTDYLYFVAQYDGTHVFSRTLAEHEAAQNRIHDQREAQGAAAPQ